MWRDWSSLDAAKVVNINMPIRESACAGVMDLPMLLKTLEICRLMRIWHFILFVTTLFIGLNRNLFLVLVAFRFFARLQVAGMRWNGLWRVLRKRQLPTNFKQWSVVGMRSHR